MVSVELSEGISEILDILKHMEKSYSDKIPQKFKDYLENNKSKNYIPNLNHSQKLNEMDLKEKTKDILTYIYMNYWSTTEEKINFIETLNKQKQKEQISAKYNPDEILKSTKKQETMQKESIALIEHTEIKWYQKLWKKVIKFFKHN